MNKHYTQAPLPFQGQKKKWNKDFKTALHAFADCHTFIDLFGGSGLLSRMVKDVYPDATVVYNDFDNYSRRIQNIPRTNALLAELRHILQGYPDNKLITEPYRTMLLDRIRQEQATGFVDYITISSSLFFSMKYATSLEDMEKNSLYNNIRQTDYDATNYLDGLTVVRQDYRELFQQWHEQPNVCFLIDPPYLSTDCGTYTGYWRLSDYLDVLHTLADTSYFYFTSNKSSIVELCEWLENHQNTTGVKPLPRCDKKRAEGTHEPQFPIHRYNAFQTQIKHLLNIDTTIIIAKMYFLF